MAVPRRSAAGFDNNPTREPSEVEGPARIARYRISSMVEADIIWFAYSRQCPKDFSITAPDVGATQSLAVSYHSSHISLSLSHTERNPFGPGNSPDFVLVRASANRARHKSGGKSLAMASLMVTIPWGFIVLILVISISTTAIG